MSIKNVKIIKIFCFLYCHKKWNFVYWLKRGTTKREGVNIMKNVLIIVFLFCFVQANIFGQTVKEIDAKIDSLKTIIYSTKELA